MNRTWGKIELLEDAADYEAFERVLAEVREHEPGMAVGPIRGQSLFQ